MSMSPAGLRRVLIVLCVTEIVSWGAMFYSFPVLAPDIHADTGWSPNATTAAFSVSLVVSAVAGVRVGRILDRFGPRLVMTIGSVIAAPALALVSQARSLTVFFLGWFVMGIGMSGTLYAPAFAALTRWWGERRVTALTAVTLVAGLSSTVFAPLTAVLNDRLDWRGTYLVLAGVLAAVTIPLHAIGLRGPWPDHVETHREPPGRIARSRPFVLLTAAMTISAFAIYGVVIIQVPLLLERGVPAGTAALALGLGGVGQLAGRIGYGRLTAHTSVRTRTAIVIGAGAVTTGLLGVLPGPAALLVAVAVLVGMARGVFTLLQATAVTDRWGPAHYGRLNGLLNAPSLGVTALAPWACTALAGLLGGYPAVFWTLAGLTALAAVLATASTGRITATDPSTNPALTTGADTTDRGAVGTNSAHDHRPL
jgi:MFS family permease